MNGVTNQIGQSDSSSFAFFTLCPKLQTHEIVENEKVAGVRYRRYAITKKGIAFFAFLDKILHKEKDVIGQTKQKNPPNKKVATKKAPTKKKATAKKAPAKKKTSSKKT
jgi:hypothetical protein